MPRLSGLLAAVIVVLGSASAALGQAGSCPMGFSPRFTVENNCGDDVWMIETAPGNVLSQPTVPGQWSRVPRGPSG